MSLDIGHGYKGFLGLVSESTWGTAVTPRTKFIELNAGGFGLTKSIDPLYSASVYRTSQDVDNFIQGNITCGGDITFHPRWEGWELLLEALMGTSSTEEVSTITVTATNKYIDFTEEGGEELTATLTVGDYPIGTSSTEDGTFCKEVKTQLDAVGGSYTVTYSRSTKKFSLDGGSGNPFTFLWKTGTHGSDNTDTHAGDLLGFDDSADGGYGDADTSDNEVEFAFKHTFTFADELDEYLTMELAEDQKAWVYEGCMVNSASFSISNNGFLDSTYNIIAEDMNTTTPNASPTFSTSGLINFKQASVTYNSVSKDVNNVSITVNNNLEGRRFLGSDLINQPVRMSKREVTGSFTMQFEGTTEFDDFIAAATRTLDIQFTSSTAIVGTTYYDLLFDMNYIKIINYTARVDNEGIIYADIDYRALSSSGTDELDIELINTQTSV